MIRRKYNEVSHLSMSVLSLKDVAVDGHTLRLSVEVPSIFADVVA